MRACKSHHMTRDKLQLANLVLRTRAYSGSSKLRRIYGTLFTQRNSKSFVFFTATLVTQL